MPKLKLLNLEEVDLISLVDRGDNPPARITMAKRADAVDPPTDGDDDGGGGDAPGDKERAWLLRALSKLLGDGEAVSYTEAGRDERVSDDVWDMTRNLSTSLRSIMADDEVEDKAAAITASLDEFTQAVTAAVPVWTAGGSVTTKQQEEGDMSDQNKNGAVAFEDIDLSALPDEAQESIKAIAEKAASVDDATAKVDELETRVDELTAALETAKANAGDADDGGDDDDELDKSELPEAVQKRLDAAEDRAQQAEKRLSKIEEERENARFVTKAKRYDKLPGWNPDDFAPVLRKIAGALDDDEMKSFEGVLSGTVEAIETGDLFKQAGADGEGDVGTATSELNKRAEAMQQADPSLSEAQARDKVLKKDAALAQRVLDEEQATPRR